ncbi:MAG: hypothetical protein HKN42_00010 [Granulosicoccus sp.]|nr:hypothetical protein [Granulosicoccus sp.]
MAHHPGLQLRSFSALFRVVHEDSGTVLDEASVLSSELGVRVDQLHEDSASTFIANYAEHQIWFMDRRRQLVHQLPVELVQHDEADGIESVQHAPAGFIHHAPCGGATGRLQGNEMIHGRLVQRWICTLPDQSVDTQWYSTTHSLVLRARTVDGVVSELTDIRERTPKPESFRPPSHFRRVGIEELLNPIVPISSYVEQKIPSK